MPITRLDDIRARVGSEIGASEWIKVDQARIDQFAETTEDRQFIHVDPAAAERTPFGGTIAHGFLSLSMLSRMAAEAMLVPDGIRMAVNYGANKVRFPAPVPVGAKIRLHAVVLSVEDVAGGGVQLTAALTVQCEGSEKPAAVVEAVYRYYA